MGGASLLSVALAGGLVVFSPAPSAGTRAAPLQDTVAAPDALAHALGSHPYFSHIALERVESPPFTFLVQRNGFEEAGRAAKLAEKYAALLAPTLQLFQDEVATPLGLARRVDPLHFTLAVLVSPGDLENYRRVLQARAHLDAHGYYDPTLNAAVVSEDPFTAVRLGEQAPSLRHLFTHVCQQTWSGAREVPYRSWALEAMACDLAQREPGDARTTDAAAVRAFLLDTQDERRRWQDARTVAELTSVADARELESFFRDQNGAGRPAPDDLGAPIDAFQRQAGLLYSFLLDAQAGAYRSGVRAYLVQAFAGRADGNAFAQSLAPATPRDLDRTFLDWALNAYDASAAGRKEREVEPALARKLLERSPRTSGASSAGTSGSATAPAAASEPLPEPPAAPGLALDLSGASGDELLALAIYRIARGRTGEGLALLERVTAGASDEATRERADRERRRAEAWVALRNQFLAERADGAKPLEFTYKGHKLKSAVLGFADGQLLLEKSRAPEHLAAEAIDPLELAQQIPAENGANAWARLYPYVLAGDPRGAKLLANEGEAGRLLADARDDYPERLHLGSALGRLQDLATQPFPRTVAEVRERLDALAEWRAGAQGLTVLANKRGALLEHARTLLAREFELLEPKDLLHGKLKLDKDGNGRLVYDFDDPREVEDFELGTYPPRARKTLPEEHSPERPFEVEKGGLVGQGSVSARSLFDLAVPTTVRCTFSFPLTDPGPPVLVCALGICDDGREHFVWASDLATLQAYDPAPGDPQLGVLEAPRTNTTYVIELKNDGSNVTLSRDRALQATIPTGKRDAGALFLCTACDSPVRIERLEIESHFRPDAFERLKRGWIERGLARFE